MIPLGSQRDRHTLIRGTIPHLALLPGVPPPPPSPSLALWNAQAELRRLLSCPGDQGLSV